ncbi:MULTISPECIES: hypothetical protein [Pseudomonas]|jgi:hypothetical protein|uniref:hypothetical protein n=1 Tax=Pseudomonas TaxID=286 RepID=UPI00062B1D1B|nr:MULTISPECIES: hypothetical protein [Pseudomonas]KKX59032.1 hypothetical protein PU99_21830 [Pseudomonas putida]NBB60696.1 hypothetical protein [Pseudomonas sp. ODNR1LW]OMQ34576.1 hypothetical protein BKX96_18735 [Pseudomonas putida]
MNKIRKRISNPMTVIAIFATLSETSAAVSLPFLDDEDRDVYVWFLISFPFYLLLLFFATLNFNYRSLYAPSDFEKGKHFIKAMDGAEQAENRKSRKPAGRTSVTDGRYTRRPSKAQDPPPEMVALSALHHHVRLPERLKDLYVIDAREMTGQTGFSHVLESLQIKPGKAARAVVFLTCTESDSRLKQDAARPSKHVRKHCRTTFCAAYNLNSQDLTVIDEHLPIDARQSVAIDDHSEGNREGQ